MNDAHLHMVVNHFPIIGSIFGLGVLIVGIFLKNNSVKNTAYFLFIVAAIFALLSMATGDGAEKLVEDMPTVGHKVIHEHEEIAEKLALSLYVLGIISIAGIFLNTKNHSKAKLLSYVTAFIAIIVVYIGSLVGTSGGEIRHTEIREDAISQTQETNNTIELDKIKLKTDE